MGDNIWISNHTGEINRILISTQERECIYWKWHVRMHALTLTYMNACIDTRMNQRMYWHSYGRTHILKLQRTNSCIETRMDERMHEHLHWHRHSRDSMLIGIHKGDALLACSSNIYIYIYIYIQCIYVKMQNTKRVCEREGEHVYSCLSLGEPITHYKLF
jgi:hypothetical protein